MPEKWRRNRRSDRIWWKENDPPEKGERLFSFDRVKVYSLFADYPYKLSPEEKQIFDSENPFWAEFFADRG